MSNKQLLESLIQPHVREILLKEVRDSDVCLELGCGPGQYKSLIPGRYIGLDITAQNYRPDLPRRVDVVADAQVLPFKENSFDVAFIVASLYQIPDMKAVLMDVHRVLRDGGKFLIFDYNYRTTKRVQRTENSGVNRNHVWTPWKLRRKVRKRGFQADIVYLYGEYAIPKRIPKWIRLFLRFRLLAYAWFLIAQLREGWNIVIGVKTASDAR